MFVLHCRNNIVPNWWFYHNPTSCKYTVISSCLGVIILWRVRERHIAKSDFPRFPDGGYTRVHRINSLVLYTYPRLHVVARMLLNINSLSLPYLSEKRRKTNASQYEPISRHRQVSWGGTSPVATMFNKRDQSGVSTISDCRTDWPWSNISVLSRPTISMGWMRHAMLYSFGPLVISSLQAQKSKHKKYICQTHM